MIKSMTGYGKSEQTIDSLNVTVEIKSVNHRYFEFSARVPREYGFLEEKLKKYCNSLITRGKVECYVSVEDLEEREMEVNVNETLAAGYVKALKELSERFGLKDDISAVTLSRYPDVITLHKASEDEERIWNAVKTVAETAVSKFIEMRETEGSKLRGDILSRADYIIECVEFIESRSPETVREYNEKLKQRMKELLGDASVDEQRLLNEAAIYADKIAVDEETVRLRSHISQLREFMNSSEAIGRKLDFLVQEINREANTIGSKAQDVDIAKKVIAIKAEVEKIREQVQNIE
ncbi:MAG: YicC family protein [Ruminococcus sp.]|nr:YicC family protein [Ruminococcus sp.]MDY3895861.1 YicC/YloC family endoribonuclease [Candidatus Fimenecus sp.]